MLNLDCISNLNFALGGGGYAGSLHKLMSYFDLLCNSKSVRDVLREVCIDHLELDSDLFSGVSSDLLVLLDTIDSMGCSNEFHFGSDRVVDCDSVFAGFVLIHNSGLFSIFYHFVSFRFGICVNRVGTKVDAFDIFYLFVGYLYLHNLGLANKIDLGDGVDFSDCVSSLFLRLSSSGLCNYSESAGVFRLFEFRWDLFIYFGLINDIVFECLNFNTCLNIVYKNQWLLGDYVNLLRYLEGFSEYFDDGGNIFSRLSDDFISEVYGVSSSDFFDSILRCLAYGD